MTNSTVRMFALTAVLVTGVAGRAAASSIYAVSDDARTLLRIDSSTLAVTTVGALGVGAGTFGDLAYDEANGIMYWIAGRGNDNLYTIDLLTGAATLVGNHGIGDNFALGHDGTDLYSDATSGAVNRLDASTGAATFVGSNGVYPGGMDWNSATGQMVLLEAGGGRFFTLDRTTGATTLLNAGAGFVNDNDLAYDRDLNGYWVVDFSGNLFFYNSAFGRSVALGSLGSLASVEFVSDRVDAVPEPASVVLLLSGLAGVMARRRR